MIRLTRINHQEILLNSDLIEHVETTPDTVLTLTTGQKVMVLESPAEITEKVIEFRSRIARSVVAGPLPAPSGPAQA